MRVLHASILTMRVAMPAIVLAVAGSVAGGPAAGAYANSSAIVQGRVYWDANGNGTQDTGERGIQTRVDLLDDAGRTAGWANADASGNYRIETAPGMYRLKPYVDRSLAICGDTGDASNSPFPASRCFAASFPVTSPEVSAAFTVAASETHRQDVRVTSKDEMAVVGRAIEEEHHAPAGSTVTALVDGKPCGSAVVSASHGEPPGETYFVLYVEGATSVTGCAAPDDTVQFEMNGRTAQKSVNYKRFVPGASSVAFVDMVFATDWMWLWSDDLTFADGRPVPEGARIVARIGQAGCGLGVNASSLYPDGGSVGFAKLAVPSERSSIGCGKPGAQVDLVAILPDRDEVIESFPWAPGLKQIGGASVRPPAEPEATATAAATPEVMLPGTGFGDSGRDEATLARALALISLVIGVAAAAVIARGLARR